MQTQCYLCGGSIEFPDELRNEVIPCPHCTKSIKLLGPRRAGAFIAFNKKQRVLNVAAFCVLVFSLFQSPWEIIYIERARFGSSEKRHSEIELAPIFSPPTGSSSVAEVIGRRLVWSAVIGTWISVAVVYAGLFVLCATKRRASILVD